MSTPKLEYGPTFQKLIVTVLHRHPDALGQVAHALRPVHFDVAPCALLYGFLRDHYLDYRGPATMPILEERLREAVQGGKVERTHIPGCVQLFDRFDQDLAPGEREYVLEKVSDFVILQSLRLAVHEGLGLMEQGKWDEFRDLFEKAINAGVTDGGQDLHYLRDEPKRLRTASEDDLLNYLPTGIPELDAELYRGGLGPGELGLILAPTNRGKSICLLSFAQRAVLGGARVLFLTLEMSAQSVATRADAALTGIPVSELDDHVDAVTDRVADLYEKYGDALIIKQWPPHAATIGMVRSYLEQLRSQGWAPDLIVLDYADLLKPQSRYSERRHELEVLYEQVRGIGVEWECPIWSAAQSNREGAKQEVVGLEHIAEAWGKAQVADVVVALCQNDEEAQMDPPRMRLFVAKNRASRAGRIIEIETGFDRMQFVRAPAA